MYKNIFNIKNWPEGERPREKLFKIGPSNLTDAELLGIIIGKGCANKTAIELGMMLLKKYDGIYGISLRMPSEFLSVKGIGVAKAAQLSAAFELSKRSFKNNKKKIFFKSSRDVAGYYIPILRGLKKEVFRVAIMSLTNRFIKDITVSEGILTKTLVHPREVFKDAILEACARIILVHNHPSGNCEPSEDDILITQRLIDAGKIIGIEILDHIIISDEDYYSMCDKGILEKIEKKVLKGGNRWQE